MDNRPIGVFDSGLGGLTAVRQLRLLLPREQIVYFGDTGRVPYGTKGAETIRRYVRQDCDFLLSKDVKMVIAACGTASSVAADLLGALPVPAVGIVEAGARAAVAATKNHKIGVIGTPATIRTGAFTRVITELDEQAEVVAQACPLFVSLVEAGWIAPDDSVTAETAARYLAPLQAAGVDTVVLGCTHFPLLSAVIAAFFGNGVTLIDPGREAAQLCAAMLRDADAQSTEAGGCTYYVSDRPHDFAAVAKRFLGEEIGESVSVIHIDK